MKSKRPTSKASPDEYTSVNVAEEVDHAVTIVTRQASCALRCVKVFGIILLVLLILGLCTFVAFIIHKFWSLARSAVDEAEYVVNEVEDDVVAAADNLEQNKCLFMPHVCAIEMLRRRFGSKG